MQGIDILFQPSVMPRLFESLLVTLWIAGVSVLASLPAGIIVGWLMTVDNKFVRLIMRIYLDIIRIMPQLALLYIVYYGFARAWNVNFDATFATIIVFIAWGAAELGDLVRGALQSIPNSQRENAQMLGMNSAQSFFYVILPQALRRLLPASVNLATRMVKTTSLAVLLGVVEVIKVGQQIIDVNRMTHPQGALWIYGVIFFMYFFISWPLSLIAGYLEKKWFHE